MKKALFLFIFLIMVCNIAYADDYYFSPMGVTTNTPSRTIHRYAVSSVQEAKKLSAAKADTEPFILCKTFFGEEQFYYRGQMVREEDLQELSRREYESSPEYRSQQFMIAKQAQKSEALSSVIIITVFIFLVLAGIGIWAGWTDRAVFFHSMPDVVFSFLMIIVIPIGLIFVWQKDNNQIPILGRHLITWPVLSGALIYQAYQSIRYTSNKFIGICVLFGRLLVSITGILIIFSKPVKKKDDHYGNQLVADTMIWMALLGGLAFFVRKLINKDAIIDETSDKEVQDALRINNRQYLP